MEPMMVEILESSFVVPSEDTPSETLVLSNLDLVATRKLNYTLYLYKNTHGANDFFSAEHLKSALAKALVLFYPLAGRQVVGHDGRDQIVCNAEGLLFVVARMDCTADRIQFEPMSPELREHFIPKEQQLLSLLMLQVTYLKCGSVVLGSAANHILIDGWSLSHFKKTWSRIVRGDLKGIVPPSFDNTPLRPRSSPKISFDYPEYTTDQTKIGDTLDSCVLSALRLSKEQVSYLKRRCSQYSKGTSVSTFCAVSALVWKCYCLTQGLPPGSKSRLYFTADIRNRLNPPLTAYFGNAVMRMSATSQVSKIMSNPIGDVAATVKASVDRVTDEYIRSYIDYLEVEGTQIKKIAPAESDLRIRTFLGMGLCDIDFGWGVPQLYSWERYTESRVVFIVNEPGKDGFLKVVPALDSSIMPKFKKVFYEELLFGRSLLENSI